MLGVSVRIASNNRALLELAEQSFGVWNKLPTTDVDDAAPPVTVKLIAHSMPEGTIGTTPFVFRMPDTHCLLFHAPDSMGYVDIARFEGVAYVGPTMQLQSARVRHSVIEMATLLIVTCIDRTPIHSTTIVRGNSALILTGPSGVGKSTLAYHSRCRKLDVLTVDATYVQTRPRFQIWGMPGRLRGFAHS